MQPTWKIDLLLSSNSILNCVSSTIVSPSSKPGAMFTHALVIPFLRQK